MRRKGKIGISRMIAVIALVVVVAVAAIAGVGYYYFLAPEEPKEMKGELSFLMNETDPKMIEFAKWAVSEFERMHPGVKISLDTLSKAESYPKVIASYRAGRLYDIMHDTGSTIPFIFGKIEGVISPLDDVIEDMGGKDAFIEGALEPFTYDGHTWAIPHDENINCLLYWKDMFEEAGLPGPPKTWDQMIEYGRKLMKYNADGTVAVYGISYPLGYKVHVQEYFYHILWTFGGTVFDEDLNIDSPNGLHSDKALQAIEVVRQLAEITDPASLGWSYYEYGQAFLKRRAAMLFYYAGRALKAQYEEDPESIPKIGFAMPPVPEEGMPPYWSVWPDSLSVKEGPNTHIAKEFVKWLMTGDVYIDWLLTVPTHLIPSTKAAAADPAWSEHPDVKRYSEFVEVQKQMIPYGKLDLVETGKVNLYFPAVYASYKISDMIHAIVIEGADAEETLASTCASLQQVVDTAKLAAGE